MHRVQIKGQTVRCEHVKYNPPRRPVDIAAKGDTFAAMSYAEALAYVKSHRISKQEVVNAVAALNTLVPEALRYHVVDRKGDVYVYGPNYRSIYGNTKTVFSEVCFHIHEALS